MLKKTIFGGCAAIACVVAVSCSGGDNSSMPETESPKTFADSIAMYTGICDGAELLNNMENWPAEEKAKFDKEKFLQGVKTILLADTSESFRQGMAIASNYVQMMDMAKAAGVDVNREMFLAYLAQTMNNEKMSDDDLAKYKDAYQSLGSRLNDKVSEYQIEQQAKAQVMMGKMYEANVAAGKQYVDSVKAADPAVKTTASGLSYKILKEGNGKVAKAGETANVIIEGKLIDGTVFMSSNGQVAPFPVDELFPGMTEALTTFPVGTRVMLYIPQELAYGQQGNQNIQPGQTLVFDVEIVD